MTPNPPAPPPAPVPPVGNAGCPDPEPPFDPDVIASVTIGGPSEPLTVGQTAQLTATVRDQNGNVLTDKPVAWKSSSEAVATVSNAGLVTAVGPGTATITATVENRSGELPLTVRELDPGPTSTGTIAYTREDELRLIEPDGSGDRLVWAAPPVDPAGGASPTWRLFPPICGS